MRISLTGFILNDSRMAKKFAKILTDEGKAVAADVALDFLIQEYVNVRLGGTSDLVGGCAFRDRDFILRIPNHGPALIVRSTQLSHLEVIMPSQVGQGVQP